MVQQTVTPQRGKRDSQPAWDVARLFPDQGSWDDEDYLALSTNQLVELSDGSVEVLPMPTMRHQAIVQYLSNLLLAFAAAGDLGRVLFAPLRVRLRPGKFAEPDVVFMSAAHRQRMGNRFWEGADLVMEVVSESEQDRQRDYIAKREAYAAAGIAEYWIVDPQQSLITVLTLQNGAYQLRGEFRPGTIAISELVPGFSVDVTATFAVQ
ncbi:MAG: Uma2 family endonuclease [Tepidisphaeraceae bacterium]